MTVAELERFLADIYKVSKSKLPTHRANLVALAFSKISPTAPCSAAQLPNRPIPAMFAAVLARYASARPVQDDEGGDGAVADAAFRNTAPAQDDEGGDGAAADAALRNTAPAEDDGGGDSAAADAPLRNTAPAEDDGGGDSAAADASLGNMTPAEDDEGGDGFAQTTEQDRNLLDAMSQQYDLDAEKLQEAVLFSGHNFAETAMGPCESDTMNEYNGELGAPESGADDSAQARPKRARRPTACRRDEMNFLFNVVTYG